MGNGRCAHHAIVSVLFFEKLWLLKINCENVRKSVIILRKYMSKINYFIYMFVFGGQLLIFIFAEMTNIESITSEESVHLTLEVSLLKSQSPDIGGVTTEESVYLTLEVSLLKSQYT